jgi:signal transduction histidine kinase
VISDLEARLAQTGGRVEVGALPTIEADPLQMRQLLQNLIGNALKFHRPDVAPVIRVSARPSGETDANGFDLWQIEVADNGIGFDEKYVDRIFKIFQRLHERHVYEGAGMGLAICRRIVERHGGAITARSAPGEGATFIITMPSRRAAESTV